MAWLTQWWTFLATILVVFVPGLAASWTIGLRRLGAWAFAPVASVAMISLLATLYGIARVPWTLPTAVIGLVVLAGVLVGASLLLRIPRVPSRAVGARWPVIVSLVVAAALITVRVVVYIGDPGNISQTNDAPFHLGAVRAIIEHANASSFGLAGLIDPQAIGSFYPGAWHATASIIAMATGGIPVTANMLTVVIAGVVWPLGIAWLTQIVLGRRLAAAAAVLMSPTIVIFPLLPMQYGVLYAYFIGVAMLPAAIAVVVALTGRQWAVRAALRGRIGALLIAGTLAGAAIAYAQPSVLLAWALMLWLCAAGGVLWIWRRGGAERWWATAGLVIALAVLAVAWWRMRHLVTADVWKAVRGGKDALVEILTAGFVMTPPAWWVALLMAIGLFAVVRRSRSRWLAFGWLAFAFLAFVAYAVRTKAIRVLLVGPWYSDPYRLAALVPVMMLPIAAAGVVLIVDLCTRAFARRAGSPRLGIVRARVGGVALVVLLAIGVGVVAAQPLVLRYKLGDREAETTSPYWVDSEAWLPSDKLALLSRLADDVPAGARVLGNPTAGTAFGYFLSGVDVYPAKWQIPRDPAYGLLGESLSLAPTDPAVCEALRTLRAGYVLDFGTATPERETVVAMPGFTGFDGVPGFELVDREGSASLWRITACS